MGEEQRKTFGNLLGIGWQMQGIQLTLRLSKRKVTKSCVENTVSCTNVQTVQLHAQEGLTVVKTKIELDSHSDACVVCEQCLVIHYCNRPVNVYGYDPKVGKKHACLVDVTLAYDGSETHQFVIFLIHQAM